MIEPGSDRSPSRPGAGTGPGPRRALHLLASTARRLRPHGPAIVLVMLLAATAVVYAGLTRVYFVADDFSNLDTIANRGPFFFIVEPFAGHMGFARNTEFYLLFAVFGAKSEPYGWLALVTHLLNVALLFRVLRLLTESLPLAALGAALWATCPLQAGVLGWFSAYGQSVSVTTVLFLVDRTLRARWQSESLPTRTVFLWAVLLIVGGTWFSTGVGALVVWPLVIALLVEPPLRRSDAIAAFVPVPLVFFCIYYSWYWLFFAFEPMKADEEMFRKVAFESLLPIFQMSAHLFAVGASGLLQGFWGVPSGDPVVVWWLVAAYVGLVVAGFAAADGRDRRRMLAFLLLSACVYGLTAAGRANVYLLLGMPPSIAARQARYHYFATFPLAVLLVLALKQNVGRLPHWLSGATVAVWASVMAYFAATTEWQIRDNRDCREFVDSTMRRIDASIDASPAGSDVSFPNHEVPGSCTGIMGYDRIPGLAGLFAMFYPEDVVRGRRVRFVEERQTGLFSAPKNTRFRALLVPPNPGRDHAP